MRAFVLFALALAGTIASTSDASAFGRRRAAATSSTGCSGGGYVSPSYGCHGGYSGGCYGGGYGSHSYGGCYGGGYAHGGYGCHGSMAYGGTAGYGTPVASSMTYTNGSYAAYGGRQAVIRATDGTSYSLAADGIYYPTTSTVNGTTTQIQSSSSYTPAATTATTITYRTKQLMGTRILIGSNAEVGTVEDMISDGAGNLEYLVVSAGDGKLVTVPWDAATFDPEKKTATVNVTQEVWKTVPTYTTATYPQFYTPAYRTDIYKVYGVTPRELRRTR